jgi:hypothetical protein
MAVLVALAASALVLISRLQRDDISLFNFILSLTVHVLFIIISWVLWGKYFNKDRD